VRLNHPGWVISPGRGDFFADPSCATAAPSGRHATRPMAPGSRTTVRGQIGHWHTWYPRRPTAPGSFLRLEHLADLELLESSDGPLDRVVAGRAPGPLRNVFGSPDALASVCAKEDIERLQDSVRLSCCREVTPCSQRSGSGPGNSGGRSYGDHLHIRRSGQPGSSGPAEPTKRPNCGTNSTALPRQAVPQQANAVQAEPSQ
jgi:hypothetical protein